MALLMVVSGGILLFYQGPNGRIRQRRQAKQAAQPVGNVRGRQRRLAALLLIIGILLLLTGLWVVPSLLVIFGVLGLILSIAGLVGVVRYMGS